METFPHPVPFSAQKAFKRMSSHAKRGPWLRAPSPCPGQDTGWGGWIRTSAWRIQSPLPYRLATPQYARGFGLSRPLEGLSRWGANLGCAHPRRDKKRRLSPKDGAFGHTAGAGKTGQNPTVHLPRTPLYRMEPSLSPPKSTTENALLHKGTGPGESIGSKNFRNNGSILQATTNFSPVVMLSPTPRRSSRTPAPNARLSFEQIRAENLRGHLRVYGGRHCLRKTYRFSWRDRKRLLSSSPNYSQQSVATPQCHATPMPKCNNFCFLIKTPCQPNQNHLYFEKCHKNKNNVIYLTGYG